MLFYSEKNQTVNHDKNVKQLITNTITCALTDKITDQVSLEKLFYV